MKLSKETYYFAKGLYKLAQEKTKETEQIEERLAKLLGYTDSYMGHISDGFYAEYDFEDALEREDITFEK